MPELSSFPVPPPVQRRVLLVDDHLLFLEGLRNLLVSQGFEVVGMAHDGLDALSQARHFHPEIILMDINMPRCDGLAATRLISSEMDDIKIIMLTISEDEQNLFEAVKSGAAGYLLKRLDAADFLAYMAELQIGHPPFSPGLAEKILKEFSRQAARLDRQPASEGTPGDIEDNSIKTGVVEASAISGELSPRQVQILTLVAQGQTYKEVADIIGLAERTVKYHMGEIMQILHLQNRAQVIAYAARMGLARTEP